MFKAKNNLVIALFLIYILLPIGATFLYSISSQWQNSILPASLTLNWYKELLGDPRFIAALMRSLIVGAGAVILGLIVLLPAVFTINLYYPEKEKYVSLTAMLPFIFPGIMLAVGLIRLYNNYFSFPPFLLLLGAYFIIIMPFIYQGLQNAFKSGNSIELFYTALSLGASPLQSFVYVIIPNIITSIIIVSLLSLSFLMGEFVLANLLVGGTYETVQVYLFKSLKQNGHLASAIVSFYFLLISLISILAFKLKDYRFQTKAETAAAKEFNPVSQIKIKQRGDLLELP
ncbi:putative spermidine/putrescine transport system permease protein [Thermosyntropha lipolytica DSM 11003]|uniref:Putative spermidine/putrescine transport system permease protein n=1 Tax=Thermosyntropha lipolytica DSM 11003 TaxID=1123382 RepID=A0A1M5LX12_9FIRM|nr:ABC transporter permease subunit [Thermosyntropha lipolytica]SHG69541.1 putative spermidine/putrescine transport system permease protein [Thermosyntropha lipolytica DSM 11003]